MTSSDQTTTKYLDTRGEEIPEDKILPDLSNVSAVVTTETISIQDYKRRYGIVP